MTQTFNLYTEVECVLCITACNYVRLCVCLGQMDYHYVNSVDFSRSNGLNLWLKLSLCGVHYYYHMCMSVCVYVTRFFFGLELQIVGERHSTDLP